MSNETDEKDVPNDKSMGVVTIEDADVSKYVAVYYTDPKLQYFFGKITEVFSEDSDSKNKVEIDFFEKTHYQRQSCCLGLGGKER